MLLAVRDVVLPCAQALLAGPSRPPQTARRVANGAEALSAL
jgi:hypothetical protein